MKKHDLLKELAHAAREDDVSKDLRWEALSASALGSEDEAALRGLAERSEQARAAYEAFRPLGADELDAMTSAVLSRTAGLAEKGGDEGVLGGEALRAQPKEPSGGDEASRRGAAVLRFRRRAPVVGGAIGVLAMAAAVAFFFQSSTHPAMPSYEIVIGHGDLVERSANGAAASIPRFAPGSLCEIVLRPASPIEGKIAVRAALLRDGQMHPWSPPIEISPQGAIRIAGPVEQVFPQVSEGEWELWVAVGSPEALPKELGPRTLERAGEGIQVLRTRVVLVGGPG